MTWLWASESIYRVMELISPAPKQHTPQSCPVLLRWHGIPPIILAGMLDHSLAILMTTYAHLARFARYASNVPVTQDKAANYKSDILTLIPIEIRLIE